MTTFLRRRNDEVDRAWMPTKKGNGEPITATDRARALFVLRGCVIVVRHPYERNPASGAGNCWCGRDPGSSLHQVVVADR